MSLLAIDSKPNTFYFELNTQLDILPGDYQ